MNYDRLIKDLLSEDMNIRKAALAGLLGLSLATGNPTDIQAKTTKPVNTSLQRFTRGVRNNNPGNIERGTDKWKGMVGDDGRFITFKSAPYGIRAMGIILKNYKKLYGLDTIEGIINRWAPPSENNTESYIKSVEQKTGIKRNQKINMNNRNHAKRLINAIIAHENANFKYPDQIMNAGLDLL